MKMAQKINKQMKLTKIKMNNNNNKIKISQIQNHQMVKINKLH